MTQKTKTIFMLAGLALSASASGQVVAPSTETVASTVPAGSVTGMAALEKIADRLDEYAAEYHLTPAELANFLRACCRDARARYAVAKGVRVICNAPCSATLV